MLRRPARLWPALLALACGPRTDATDDTGFGTGSTDHTGTLSAGLTTGPTSGSDSGTGEITEPETSCAALCGAYDTCAPELGGPDCLSSCIEGIAPPLPEACAAAWMDLYACLGGLDCMALLGDGSCPSEDAAIDAACPEGETCTVEIDSQSAKRCSYQEVCPGEPTRGLECMNATCTCIVDGVEGATCPADGICTNTGELGTKMLTCCS